MNRREECIKEIKDKLAELEANGCTDEREFERWNNLLECHELGLFDDNKPPVPAWNKDDYLLPEYRKGGYFTSQDYFDKCDEFHNILEEYSIDYMEISRNEYIYLKKEFFKNVYGITWLAEEEQFLPGVKIDVHIDKF
ncbi:MAG: hypothetical protein IKL08_05090 [Clostridia bacterium]|nr:hypothetical protein [Clostridia bacterium]